jgi:hypothetical protein
MLMVSCVTKIEVLEVELRKKQRALPMFWMWLASMRGLTQQIGPRCDEVMRGGCCDGGDR